MHMSPEQNTPKKAKKTNLAFAAYEFVFVQFLPTYAAYALQKPSQTTAKKKRWPFKWHTMHNEAHFDAVMAMILPAKHQNGNFFGAFSIFAVFFALSSVVEAIVLVA